jgi:hypothetical protein
VQVLACREKAGKENGAKESAPSRQMAWPAHEGSGADDITKQTAEEVEQEEQEEKMADTELPKPEIIEVGTDAYLAWHARTISSRAT